MTLLRHLIAADLRRSGWLIVVWIACVAAGDLVYASLPLGAWEERSAIALRLSLGILWLARQVYRLVLIAQIVHTHPAVGSTAFWMTRPIPPRILAASKVALIGVVFVGAPVAGDVALAQAYSVPPADLLISAVNTAIVNGLWVALCVVVAVVTRSLAQFVLVWAVAVSSLVVVPFALDLILSVPRLGGPAAVRDVAFSPVLAILAAIELLILLLVASFVQYSRRSRPRTIAVGAGGVSLALALVWFPAPLFLVRTSRPPQWAAGASLQLADAAATPRAALLDISGRGEVEAVVRSALALPSLPPGWYGRASLREATVQTGGGPVRSRRQSPTDSAALGRDAENATRTALREALGVDRLPDHYFGPDAATLFVLAPAEAGQLTPLRGEYHGRFHVVPTHLELAGVVPLVPGAAFRDGSFRVVVRGVEHDSGLQVRVQLSGIVSLLPGQSRPGYEFHLRNQARREALSGVTNSPGPYLVVPGASVLASVALITPGVWTSAASLRYRGGAGPGRPAWELSPDWLEGAELAVVRVTTGGSFDAALDIDPFMAVSKPFPRVGPPRF